MIAILFVNIIVTLVFCLVYWLIVFREELFKRNSLYKWTQTILLGLAALLIGCLWRISFFDEFPQDKLTNEYITVESVKELIREVLVEEGLKEPPCNIANP